IPGTALKAIEGDDQYEEKNVEEMEAVDTYIPAPERDSDQPFMMPDEDVFSNTGRGTVATGRVERSHIKVGEEVEIIGLHDKSKT
ncbi:elongation factor Tu, partial [Staphylococcus aureus]